MGIISVILSIDKMSTDSEDLDIQQELKNIENVISLTRVNIDALNAKFADFQQPPPMYLKEYDDLTSKLHELEAEKRRLLDQLSNGRESPEVNDSYYSQQTSELYRAQQYDQCSRPKFLRAHLPNQQRTSVQVREGLTLREALAKAMKLRNLICEMCCVYRVDCNIPINWDVDISHLECKEIVVKIIDKFPIPTSISHNFVRKTFFSLVFCEYCRRLLFQGFHCRTCGYKFHQRCASGVPSLCQQVCKQWRIRFSQKLCIIFYRVEEQLMHIIVHSWQDHQILVQEYYIQVKLDWNYLIIGNQDILEH